MSNTEYWPGLDPEPGSRRQNRAQQEADRKRRRTRTAVILVTCAVFFAAAVGFGYQALAPMIGKTFGSAADYTGPGTDTTTRVTIEQGEFGSDIGKKLVDSGVVKSVDAFVVAAKADKKSSGIQPGTYELPQQIPAKNALALLLDPKSKKELVVQIIEGKRASEIYAIIAKQFNVPVDQVVAASKGDLGLPPEAQGNPEGYLFPATYNFPLDAKPVDALKAMVTKWSSEMKRLGIGLPEHRDLLIKASIIEAEGGSKDVAPKVARVIENRLKINMALQMDSSVSYFHNERKIDTTDKQRSTQNPYNTYANPGLPIGPISNPGASAYEAVKNPAPGDWLYFVAVNTLTGETKFASNKAEHDRNVAQWRRWAADERRKKRANG